MKNIYVGNLSFNINEADLRGEFARYGQVGQVTIVRDRETGQPRGFAFVEMANDMEAENAIKGLNGSNLNGRTLNVNEARGKREYSGPPRGQPRR
jgi:RNA recognition motif-containing protein